MSMQVLVGDRTGRIIAELEPEITTVAWRLNEIPSLKMRIARTDSKCTQTNLQYGNRVLISFADSVGLPNWGGVIDVPSAWDRSSITVSAWGIEYLLKFRTTVKTRAFNDECVGRIFKTVLKEADWQQPMGLLFGPIWTGGRPHSPRYHFKSAWSIIQECVSELEHCDAIFKAIRKGDFIRFQAELYERAGQDKRTKYAFREGKNVSEVTYTEQGPIINEFAAVGAGTTWGDDRKYSIHYDRATDQKYGLRQSSKVFPDVTMETTLIRWAFSEVQENAEAHTRIGLRVANARPARFVDYDLGDILGCTLPSYGWSGYDAPVRVLAREYDTVAKSCNLVVEEEKIVNPVNIGWRAERTGEE